MTLIDFLNDLEFRCCEISKLEEVDFQSALALFVYWKILSKCKWVFPKIGGNPPKWMVKIVENPIKMDDLGVPLFLETPK